LLYLKVLEMVMGQIFHTLTSLIVLTLHKALVYFHVLNPHVITSILIGQMTADIKSEVARLVIS